ncbi:MAG TPA: aldose epimerase family protein [Acidobacteriaceae bacterium]|jgi:aldose 1-epimerase|nr:aldose epimerase family protein [Acidobacteriaceae bacterium]
MKLVRVILLFMTSLSAAAATTSVTQSSFGHMPGGDPVQIFTLKSAAVELKVMTYGARVVSLTTKDRKGAVADVVLGYGSFDAYLKDNKTFFGSVPGRYANRIANGRFTLEGKPFQITVNEAPNALHGGKKGFDQLNWTGKQIPSGVELTLVSPDGDQGFPGKLTAHVRYTLQDNVVRIEYSATTDKPTVVNLTNHTYFNLAGQGHGTILDQVATIDADKYTPVNATLIPTGELAPVAGTPFDFTHPQVIGSRINSDHPQIKLGGGYDHNWVLRGAMGQLHPAAQVFDPQSGRVLSVETTQPGVQFYSGNFLDGTFSSPAGTKYAKRTGFCLETQHFPDSPNHPSFPSTELKPGQTFHSTTTWAFTTRS